MLDTGAEGTRIHKARRFAPSGVEMDEIAVQLPGAGRGRTVWRIGNTVRRATGPWTSAVHALLGHLESVGFDAAPRVLGVDEAGREVLTYIEGVEGRRVVHDDALLTDVARLIRRYHDAVADFAIPPDAVWRSDYPKEDSSRRIVCHNDLAPYNTIYAHGRPRALIDWDLAGPAPYLWDVALAAWTFVPLYTDDDCAVIGVPIPDRGPRLRLFCDAYGLTEREEFVNILRERVSALTGGFARRGLKLIDSEGPVWHRQLG